MAKKKSHDKENLDEATVAEGSEAPEEAAAEETSAEPAEPTLEEQLAASQEEARKNWDLYLRERADMENVRKRLQREKEELSRFANENLLREFLPVLDNLERAIEHARQGEASSDALLEGVEMTVTMFGKLLAKFGVTALETVGTPFDPSQHEAMGQVESSDHPPNAVAMQFQKGYKLYDRLLRPALVMVAKAPAEPRPEEDPADENK